MMHKAWRGIEEMPYSFSRSSIQFYGHTGQKIASVASILMFKVIRPVTALWSSRFALFAMWDNSNEANPEYYW